MEAFEPRIEACREFALQNRVLLLKSAEGIGIDIALGALPFEEEAARRSQKWFSERSQVVMNTVGARNDGGSFWYLLLPGVLYSQLAVSNPDIEGMGERLRAMADRYCEVVETLGGANADFNHTGFDFEKNAPIDNARCKEPDAAAGIAYIEHAAWTQWNDPRHLQTARWCLDFLERRGLEEGNPLYETLLYFAPALAAKFNAENGAHYDLAKLVNWCLSENHDRGSTRPYWGILARTFGDTEVHGLQGSTRAGGGYAFAMNTFNAAAALAPLARYDERFAAPLAKWLTHVANNARLFFPDQIPRENQSCPRLVDTILKAVPYEGLREKAKVKWRLGAVETGSSEPDANLKLQQAKRLETTFQCDSQGCLSIPVEIELPENCDGGGWRIEARVASGGALFHIRSAPAREGPWQNCGGFTGPIPHTHGSLAAGGPLNGANGRRTIWIKIDGAGRHEAGGTLTIRSLQFFALLRTSPWASGDLFTDGRGPTDLAAYGGAYLRYLGAPVRRTEQERALAFDLSATDFLSKDRTPVWLCYNADKVPRTVALVPTEPVLVPAAGTAIVRALTAK